MEKGLLIIGVIYLFVFIVLSTLFGMGIAFLITIVLTIMCVAGFIHEGKNDNNIKK